MAKEFNAKETAKRFEQIIGRAAKRTPKGLKDEGKFKEENDYDEEHE